MFQQDKVKAEMVILIDMPQKFSGPSERNYFNHYFRKLKYVGSDAGFYCAQQPWQLIAPWR
jgi:hypothetical protein